MRRIFYLSILATVPVALVAAAPSAPASSRTTLAQSVPCPGEKGEYGSTVWNNPCDPDRSRQSDNK